MFTAGACDYYLLHCCLVFDYGNKDTTFFLISKFFLTFSYKMFWKWYYKSFPVRMKIITYNTVIIFCHLVEFAIFAVGDFLSLFSIAVFNIPISHRIIILLFLLQSYCFFRYFQIFLTFFIDRVQITPQSQNLFCLTHFSGRVPLVCWSWSCVLFPSIIHTYIHARTYTRARGFLDHNF